MLQKERVVRIVAGHDPNVVATGYAIGPRHVLTARAAVAGREPVTVTVGARTVKVAASWSPKDTRMEVLLLTTDEPVLPGETLPDLASLQSGRLDSGAAWSAWIAPTEVRAAGDHAEATLGGATPEPELVDSAATFEWSISTVKPPELALGAPVVSGGAGARRIVGVVVGAPGRGQTPGTVAVVPTSVFATETDFLLALFGESSREHATRLTDLEARIARLLGTTQSLPGELVTRLDSTLPSAADDLAKALVCRVSGFRVAEHLYKIHADWSDSTVALRREATVAREVLELVLPASQDWRSAVVQARHDLERHGVAAVAASTATMAEVIMAGADARRMRLVGGRRRPDGEPNPARGLSAIRLPNMNLLSEADADALRAEVVATLAGPEYSIKKEAAGAHVRFHGTGAAAHKDRHPYYLLIDDSCDGSWTEERCHTLAAKIGPSLPGLKVVWLRAATDPAAEGGSDEEHNFQITMDYTYATAHDPGEGA